jgi:hypothetical protein
MTSAMKVLAVRNLEGERGSGAEGVSGMRHFPLEKWIRELFL